MNNNRANGEANTLNDYRTKGEANTMKNYRTKLVNKDANDIRPSRL